MPFLFQIINFNEKHIFLIDFHEILFNIYLNLNYNLIFHRVFNNNYHIHIIFS